MAYNKTAAYNSVVYNKLSGIIEIKCLKVLRNRSIADLILAREKKEFNVGSRCFTINGNTLVLKKKHAYYLQIQQQLLVTGASYCDFVLHTPMGEPSVQRIYIDKQVAADIVKYSYEFGRKVLVREYFLMSVPRNLPPVIML